MIEFLLAERLTFGESHARDDAPDCSARAVRGSMRAGSIIAENREKQA
jgi:hypothetical protein